MATARRNRHNPERTAGLEAFRIGATNAFVIGSLDARVSFIGQQTRALTFVREMSQSYMLPEAKVLVVGGGVAGITTALAFAREGACVVLAERREGLLLDQADAGHRFVHPTANDWVLDPQARRDSLAVGDLAPLPWPYSWTAGPANEVIKQLRTNFEDCVNADRIQRIEPILECSVRSFEQVKTDEMLEVTLRGTPRKFEFVVFTVGFGPEVAKFKPGRSGPPEDSPPEDSPPPEDPPPEVLTSYWHSDDLLASQLQTCSVLVSGRGDGALIDAIRAAYGGASFDHAAVLGGFTDPGHSEFRSFAKTIVSWLDRMVSEPGEHGDEIHKLFDTYWSQICDRSGHADVSTLLRARFAGLLPERRPSPDRPDTEGEEIPAGAWILGGSTSNRYLNNSNSALIHRMLVWILVQTEYIHVLEFDKVESVNKRDSSYEVKLRAQDGNHSVTKLFDKVVLRHGPNPVSHLGQLKGLETAVIDKFKKIASLCLLPPRVGPEIAQWARLGRSILMLPIPELAGTRFLAGDKDGPWMMEFPVGDRVWSFAFGVSLPPVDRTRLRVSYDDARDFVRRFTGKLDELGPEYPRFRVRLPLLGEWLRFAGRDPNHPSQWLRYPWGDDEWTPAHAHFARAYDHPIDYPFRYLGRGPMGHVDLLGEVWEWCEIADGGVALVGGSKFTDIEDVFDEVGRLQEVRLRPNEEFEAIDVGMRIVLELDNG